MLKIKDTLGIIVDANKDAGVDSAKLIAGNILNQRVNAILMKNLPAGIKLIAGSYLESNVGKALIANTVAGALIHTMPNNGKVALAAEAMIKSASLSLASSFNIEEIINELLDGVPGLEPVEKSSIEKSSIEDKVSGS
ncbi:MAG: hypothetical protein L3I99_05580 [Sulfurimonas sp.]|nr:hypothetical protein [Sulfurimonas sp.]